MTFRFAGWLATDGSTCGRPSEAVFELTRPFAVNPRLRPMTVGRVAWGPFTPASFGSSMVIPDGGGWAEEARTPPAAPGCETAASGTARANPETAATEPALRTICLNTPVPLSESEGSRPAPPGAGLLRDPR